MAPELAIGGSSDTRPQPLRYVDYLDIRGTVLASAGTAEPANWYYKRVWRVSAVAAGNTACPAAAPVTGCLEEITVSATVKASAAGGLGLIPRSTVAALKTLSVLEGVIVSRELFDRRQAVAEDGFTVVEMLVALAILMVVCGTVMRGVLGLTDVSRMVSNRTDMHNSVGSATDC